MAKKHEYEIAFVGLKPGEHSFEYEINEDFFEDYAEQDFTAPKVTVKLILDKKVNFMMLHFQVGGSVLLSCDLCGTGLRTDLWDDFEMIVKLVDNPEQMNETEEDPDIFYISKTESHINVKNWLFEFVNLSVPQQRNCGADSDGNTLCDAEALERLNKLNSDNPNEGNPIWKDLDKFRNN